MDAVAGVASITQLAVYSQCAAKYLMQLYNTARNALSFVQGQQQEILVLLQVIHRLSSDSNSLDSDLLLPVLIRIIDIARTLGSWFDGSGVLGLKWTLVKRRSQIDDALKTLKEKSDILGLYLIERNHSILLRLESTLKKETRNTAGSVQNMSLTANRELTEVPEVVEQVLDSAYASGSEASPSRSSTSSTDRPKHMDEATRQTPTAAGPEDPSTSQITNQTPQERQRMKSTLKIGDNKITKSDMSFGNNCQDLNRDFDIVCNGNEGEDAKYSGFNREV